MRFMSALLAAALTITPVSATNSLYIGAEFDNEYVDYGTNKFTVFGENNSSESKTFKILSTVSENGRLISSADGGTVTVAAGSAFSKNQEIEVPQTTDIGNAKIDVYLWDVNGGGKPISQEISSESIKFKYTLTEDSKTSAAVYDKNGRLIKTLWSVQQGYEGDNFGIWDGTDDAGVPQSAGQYEVKVLSHNVEYVRDSAIANNTTGTKTKEMISSYNTISDMCLLGDRMYIAEQYMEGGLTCAWVDISNPRQIAGSLEGKNTKLNIKNATDGNYVYWMTVQQTPFTETAADGTQTVTKINECFIYAVDPDTPYNYYLAPTVDFPSGRRTMDIWNVRDQFSAIGIVQYSEAASVYSTGAYGYGDLAVQTSGDKLAAVYGSRDFLRIMNKTTGATLKDNALISPKALTFDNAGNLWVAYGTEGNYSLKRFTVNSDGTITENLAAPSSVNYEEILALDLNPAETQLTVSYGGDTNKVVSYNLSDWSVAWSFGSGESYKDDPAVYDDKLLFKQRNGLATAGVSGFYDHTFIEYEDNDTVWIGDVGNYRCYKLNISGSNVTIDDAIYSPKQSYAMSADANNPTRVLLGNHEYEIDYSIDGGFDCWKLKNNWSYEAEQISSNTYKMISAATTLSNGRTYFEAIDKADGIYKIYELQEKTFRNTGIVVDGHMLSDGSFAMNKTVKEKANGVLGNALYRKYVTGFDGSNNPIFGEWERVAFVPNSLSGSMDNRTEMTESGYVIGLKVTVDSLRTTENPTDMRLWAYDASSTGGKYLWQAAPATFKNYYHDFPSDGALEIGRGTWNTVHFQPQIFGNNIIFCHSGEGYDGGQNERFYHFTDDGLVVGVYGISPAQQTRFEDYENQPVVNGNGFCWNMVFPDGKDADTAYIYQAGEARYSGLMRFKVTGLNSIKTQSVYVSIGSNLRSGLTAEVFEGNEYLITNTVKKTTVDKVDTVSGGEGLNKYGIRYTGYITKPSDSKQLTKIWVYSDGVAALKINGGIKASGSGMIGTAISMEDGKAYRVELTVNNDSSDISQIKLLYDAEGEVKEYPMLNMMTENVGNESVRRTVDLLSNLPHDATFTENSHGWNFGDMIASAPSSTIKTNYAKYDYSENPDVDFKILLMRNESTKVERSLGNAMENINEWEINAELMMLGKLNGWYTGTVSGQESRYIDILDENDKILARFEARNDYGVYGNNKLIYQTEVPNGYSEINIKYLHELSVFNPLKIRCTNGSVIFEYKDGSVSTPIYDLTANWKKPAKIRLSALKQSRQDPYSDSYETIFGKLLYTQSAATDTHLVTFYDEDRTTVLKRENVKTGEGATAPNAQRPGYILSWSTDFGSVTSNMNVYAIYTLDEAAYTVYFYNEDGTYITSTETVFGQEAEAPDVSKEGYVFLGWYKADGTQVNLSEISGNTTVYAKYQRTGKFTETFENFAIDYTNKTVSGNTFTYSMSDNLFTTNSYDSDKVMSVKEVTGADGKTTKALYINPYRSAVGEEYKINFGEIRSGKTKISFDYKIDSYALSTGFNYFGTLMESGTGNMAACMTEIRSFGSQNPFAAWVSSGVIRRVDKVMDANGYYSSFTDVSSGSEWHNISYEVDMDANTYTLTVDNTEIGTYSFFDTVSYVDSLYFKGLTYSSSQNIGRYYIDNIEIEYLS